MKNPETYWHRTWPCLLFAAALALPQSSPAQLLTNWTAFNDHGPSAGTAANVTPYNMRGGPLTGDPASDFPTSGYLTNATAGALAAGQQLSAALEVTTTGTVSSQFANAAMGNPNPGTPAYDVFNGFVDLANGGSSIGLTAGQEIMLTFKNLDPTMHYSLRATAVRAGTIYGANHPGRWTYSQIEDADSFVDAHTAGVLTSATPLAEYVRPDGTVYPALNLAAGQAVFQSGMNTEGNMVGWDDIRPGADGTFSVRSRYWGGVVTNTYLNFAPAPPEPPVTVTNAFDNLGYGLNAFRLIEYGPLTPVAIVTQPAASTTLTEQYPLILSVAATGTGPQYQWYKGADAIPGANTATFVIPAAAVTDSGNYTVVVNNSQNSVTSAVAQVTVQDDTIPPSPVSVIAGGYFTNVTIQFNERVQLTDALVPFSYSIVDGSDPNIVVDPSTVTLVSAGTTESGTAVVLGIDPPLTENKLYKLKISGIYDLAGNLADETAEFSFQTWVVTPAGGVKFEIFTGIGGTAVANLASSANYPNNPVAVTNLTSFSTREFLADDTLDNYGGRLRAMFIPQASGTYVFYLSSDDGSQLFLNPSGPDPAGKTLVQQETGCCNPYSTHATAPFAMVAGQAYYLEALYKEGGGGDYCHVWAGLQGVAAPTAAAAALTPADAIPGTMLGYPSAPAGVAGTVTITQDLASVSTNENQTVTFTVGATNTYGLPMFYQWRKNGDIVPGISGASYPLVATLDDDGAEITVEVSIVGSKAASAPATISVAADTTPPTVTSVSGDSRFTTVKLMFDEFITLETAEDVFGYEITAGPNLPRITSASLQADGKTVFLGLDAALHVDAVYTLAVKSPTDLAGNTIATGTTVQLQTWKIAPGFITFETYDTGGGNSVNLLTSSPNFPNHPRETFYISSFDTHEAYPDNSHESFGGRLSGVFIPPTSGNWIFYLSSDDSSELYLNLLGADAAGKTIIAAETACCNPFATHPSAPQALTAGQPYYLEALYKEGGGGDFCRVAAKLETDPADPNSLSAIPGAWLATYANPVGLSVAITQNPTDQVGVVSSPGKVALSQDFNTSDGGYAVTNSGTPPTGPWTYNAARGSWSANGGEGVVFSLLHTPTFIITEAGPAVLTFNHRYNFEDDGTIRWDGGQVRLSVNGSAFATVPASNFSQNGYATDRPIGGNNILNGQFGFNNKSEGWDGGSYIQSVAVLGTFNPGDQLTIQFAGGWDEGTVNPSPNWEIDQVVVNEGVFPLYAQDFAADNGSFSVTNIGTVAGPWTYNSGTGTWSANGGEGVVASLLNSPAITVGKDGFVKLTFSHRYNFEDGSTLWDGGQIRVSVNGGPYETVPGDSFATNGYAPGLFVGNGILIGQRGFNGQSAGYLTNGFITSIASLGAFAAGDTVSVQFAGSWDDGFVQPPSPNWEIDSLTLNDGIAFPVTFSVAATASVPGSTITPIVYQWQVDRGTGFEDIADARSSSYTFFVTEADNGNAYRCVVSVPGASAVSDAAFLTIGATAPTLTITRVAGTVVVSWPASASAYVLEESDTLNGTPAPWALVPTATYETDGTTTWVTIPAAAEKRFYRLHMP